MKNLIQLTDKELVQLFVDGNNEAFEVLLNKYKSKVYTYIFLIVRNKELTEDIFQETFIKVITNIRQGRYVDSGRFLGWVNRIAHNLVIDHFRKKKNENTFSTDGLEYDYVNNSEHIVKSVEDVISNEQVLRDVVHMIDFLPDAQKKVVKMRYFEELSFKEIAERTDVSINTALGRMRYALMNMRKIAAEKNIYLELK
ncbi:MAG: RNA polymerase sigma factor [Bacteroidales bacterium]|nr:RNA polymerase sigma factor [Bacteroidales bacterium]